MTMEAELVASGRWVRIETRGRRSGAVRAVSVGFVDGPEGSIVVAAGDPDADWAANLADDPTCRVTIGERAYAAVAEPVDGPERSAAIRDLILRYGTPAERLGHGPVLRLRPAPSDGPS